MNQTNRCGVQSALHIAPSFRVQCASGVGRVVAVSTRVAALAISCHSIVCGSIYRLAFYCLGRVTGEGGPEATVSSQSGSISWWQKCSDSAGGAAVSDLALPIALPPLLPQPRDPRPVIGGIASQQVSQVLHNPRLQRLAPDRECILSLALRCLGQFHLPLEPLESTDEHLAEPRTTIDWAKCRGAMLHAN